MNIRIFFISVITILTSFTLFGQIELALRKKSNGKLKNISPSTFLIFKEETDSLGKRYYHGRILELNDTTLTIIEFQKKRQQKGPKQITLKLTAIKSISNLLFDSNAIYTLDGLLIVGAIAGLIATPIVWAVKGEDSGQDTLVFTGILWGIVILPGLIKRKFDLKKWEIADGG